MATAAEIPDETTTAGDAYTLVHVAEGRAFDVAEVWAAQARRRAGDTEVLAAFTVTSRAGTTDDEATDGNDETGNTVVIARLTGAQTRLMVGTCKCDLQATPSGSDPLTFVKWDLVVEQDVTR